MRRFAYVSAVGMVLSVAIIATGGGRFEAAGASTLKSPRLQAFGSCPSLLAYAKQHALPLVNAYGLGGVGVATGVATPVTAPAAPGASRDVSTPVPGVDYSTTNVQEDGVDEPDLVKSNGSTLYVVRGDRLFAVDVRARKPRLLGSLQLPQGATYELLLHGDRLLVLSRGGIYPVDMIGRVATPIRPGPTQSSLTEVDVSDPSAMRVVRGLSFDAEILTARLVGSVVRVVTTSSMPQALPFRPPPQPTPDAMAAALAHNRDVVKSSKIGGWLPKYRIKGRRGETLARRTLVGCNDVRRPAVFSGLGLLTVLTIDLAKGVALTDSDSIVADGRTVYASQKRLYVATQRWFAQPINAASADPPKVATAIHEFDISDPDSTTYRGSGTVSGYLMNQWSLSEQDGVLRAATTEEPTWWNPGPQEESESFVTTLKEQGGALVQLGRVGGLGKGERVYAVRFSGDTGYVVTFRQVDPLYTLDLSRPAHPAVLGELKIQGYSAYLHPIGDGLLLGVGQDASEEGRVRGTQLSLFDVSDLRRPTRLQTYAIGAAWSEAESDHHAFLWWGPSKLAVLPVQAFADKPFVGAVGFHVARGGIAEAGRVTHSGESAPGGSRVAGIPIRRSAVVGDTLYTISDQGVKGTALGSFADQGWVAFPISG
jgi:hypothetical protein